MINIFIAVTVSINHEEIGKIQKKMKNKFYLNKYSWSDIIYPSGKR